MLQQPENSSWIYRYEKFHIQGYTNQTYSKDARSTLTMSCWITTSTRHEFGLKRVLDKQIIFAGKLLKEQV